MTATVLKTDGVMPVTEAEIALLDGVGATLRDEACPTEADLIAHGRDAAAIVTVDEPLTAKVIGELRSCRVIARLGIGVDKVDVEAATAAGIWVTNVPDGSVHETSDHALALLLAAARRVVALDAAIRRGTWDTLGVAGRVRRLTGLRLGLVGFGRIARTLAPKAAALGLEVCAHDPYQPAEAIAAEGVRPAELDELLRTADFVSLHAPLTPETERLLDRDRLALMKPTAILVNVARGALVDEDALVEALDSGRIAGAALDVFASEPLPASHPLVGRDDVVLTSHAAFYSEDSVAEVRRKAFEDVARVLGGSAPLRPVNRPEPR
jgi:D-3-phosphoglycerate dehydrogenase / 2-oxoglutarate reductase